MFNKSKFITLVILASMVLKVHSTKKNNNTFNNKCVDYGEICDLKNKVTCCDEDLICQLTVAGDFFMCARESTLGNFCQFDEDCASIWHGKCSIDHTCVCQPNHVPKNNKYCAPLVDEYCLQNYQCGTENSVCLKNKCRCKDGYFLDSKYKCLPSTIGKKCETDRDCNGLKFAKCSKKKICVCVSNTVALTPAHCYPLLDSPCQVDEDCKVEFSICMKNKCVCQRKHSVHSDKCLPMYLGMPCQADIDCRISLNNTMCNYNKCTCVGSYFETKDGVCKLERERLCFDDELCFDENSFCLERKCHCKPQYDIQGSKCVPLNLNGSCDTDADCKKIQFAVCSKNKTCICKDGSFEINRSTCVSKLGGICHANEQCHVKNSTCVDNRCQCKLEYLNVADTQCISRKLFTSCRIDADCYRMQFSICSSDKQCVCKDGYVDVDERTCAPKLGQTCETDDQCHIKNSICTNNHCQCELEFLNVADKKCILIESAEWSCHNNDPNCRLFTNTKFLENGQHVCTKYKVKINSAECSTSMGELCRDNDQCNSEYSICVRNKCKCKFEYVSHSNIDCPIPYLGMPCLYDSYCEKRIKNTVCLNNICTCNGKYSPVNNQICRPKLQSSCLDDELCAPKNSICIDGKCTCDTDFIQQKSKCIALNTTLSKSCEEDHHCESSHHLRCSEDKICVCKENTLISHNNICNPVLGGFCLQNQDCGVNFDCVDFKCQCKRNFLAMSADKCVPARQLYSCNDKSNCGDIWHWRCSDEKKCVCNVNNIAINNSTCLPILGGYCWRDDQCRAKNSICFDFHCECKPDYVPISDNVCVLQI